MSDRPFSSLERLPARAADARSVRPAALAALAESGLIFLPLQELVREGAGAGNGPLVSYPAFVMLFVGGVAAATAQRRFRAMPAMVLVAAAAVGAVQVLVWGSAGAGALAGSVLLALAVAARVLRLAIRDWRDPIGFSFAVGTLLALLEVAIGGEGGATWRLLLPVAVAVFFVASLASRAESVRLDGPQPGRAGEGGPEAANAEGAEAARRMALVSLAGLSGVLALAVAVGGHGGLIQLAGRRVLGLVALVLVGVLYVVVPLLQPVFWAASKIHVDLLGIFRRAVERLRGIQPKHHLPTHTTATEQIFAFLLLAALVTLFVWSIRRRRGAMEWFLHRAAPAALTAPGEVGHGRLRLSLPVRLRREMPEETVRRWYAEVLVLLEGRELAKPAAATPAEFLSDVAAAFPAAATTFAELTRAYEDVRYGNRALALSVVADLRRERAAMHDVIRRDARADEPEDAVEEQTGGEIAGEPGPAAR